MKIKWILVSGLMVVAGAAAASNVAIIDSGVDYRHHDLTAKIWANPVDSTENSRDEDSNGQVDDIRGWNFAESNNQIIDYQYLNTFSQDCYLFFEVQGKKLLGTATPAEQQWYTDHRNNPDFIKELQKFGNFVHGTHVSGISSIENVGGKLIGIKLIPTVQPGTAELMRGIVFSGEKAANPLVKMLLGMMASRQTTMLTDVGKYVATVKADVANGSFGTSVAAVKPIVAQLVAQFTGAEPTPEDLDEYSIYFVSEIVKGSQAFVDASPNTLFVFAAGNDGTDNDVFPTSPANVKTENTIAVAATVGVRELASFSNTGATMVEVAAPGVVIQSTIPGDLYMPLSGTSMAAPFVTNVASRVKDANPVLMPAEIKRIIMGTVDVKAYLAGKVKTSGIVNPARAIQAAALSRTLTINDAINQAKATVADYVDNTKGGDILSVDDLVAIPLPSPFR